MLVEFAINASYVKIANDVKENRVIVKDKDKDSPKRGPVCGFSRKSKKRLFDIFNQIPKNNPPSLFNNHTWSDGAWTKTLEAAKSKDVPVWQEAKLQWREQEARIRRRFEGRLITIFTRWEWRKRQSGVYQGEFVPHVHCFIWGIERMDVHWLRAMWYDILGDPSRVHVRKVYDWRGAAGYMGKHHGKESTSGSLPTGRTWGITGKKYLGITLVVVHIGISQFHRMRRVLRYLVTKLRGHKCHWGKVRGQGMTAYVGDGVARQLLSWVADVG